MIRISRLGWFSISLVFLAPWAVLLWIHNSSRSSSSASQPATAQTALAVTPPNKPEQARGELRPGPWGKINYRRIAIEPPEEFIPDGYVPPSPHWTFKQMTAPGLEALWDEANLSSEQRAALNHPNRRKLAADAIVIDPSAETILGLSPAARSKIYSTLAQFPENPAQREPFRFRGESVDEWFEGSGLPHEIIALTKRLIYERRGTAFFSDYDLVLPRIAEGSERTLYLKTLSRKSALLVTLLIDRAVDVETLGAYWGRGRRAKDVKPLLQSLVRQPNAASLDIVHLIPRFARSLIYTFPLPSDDPEASNRDCHWTSFNFFNEIPDERFTNIDFVKQTLLSKYYPVAGEPQMGDIIMLLQPGGVVVHSCVYIADDIVFTKNGPSFAVPWQFAQLDSVLAFYSVGEIPIETRRYRSKHD